MTTKNYANSYIPEYAHENVPQYERDGLLTYIDQLKYQKFTENRNEHFKSY